MFDFLKKTHKITYASVSFDGTRPYNEDSLKILRSYVDQWVKKQLKIKEAERMLDAVQGSEDKTKKKVDEKKAVTVGNSGKNW